MRPIFNIAVLIAGAACVPLAAAADWTVPEEAAAKTNPIEMTADSVAAGQALYAQHCLDCHGATGAGDGDGAALMGMELESLTDPAVQSQSDGVLFHKTAVGRGDMPGYLTDEVLTEEQIWHLVNYMRSLADGAGEGD